MAILFYKRMAAPMTDAAWLPSREASSAFKGKKVLVIGASGFLGEAIYHYLVDTAKHPNVTGTYNGRILEGESFRQLDVTRQDNLQRVIRELSPDIIIYAAGEQNPEKAKANPARAGTLNVDAVQAIKTAGFDGKLVYIGSNYIFGNDVRYDKESVIIPRPVATKPNPLNDYGKMKLDGERAALGLFDQRALILRLPLLIGFNSIKDRISFPGQVLKSLQTETSAEYDDEQIRHPLDIKDAARALFNLLDGDKQGVFQLDGREAVTKFTIANRIARLRGLGDSSLLVGRSASNSQDRELRPADTKMANNTGYEPGSLFMSLVRIIAGYNLAVQNPAVFFTALHTVGFQNPALKPLANGQIRIQIIRAGICGTDARVLSGSKAAVNSTVVSMDIVLGHEAVGRVVEIGDEVTSWKIGDLVAVASHIPCGECPSCKSGDTNLCSDLQHVGLTVDGVFADYITVPATEPTVFPVSEKIKPSLAAMVEPLACVWHGVQKLGSKAQFKNIKLIILGGGPIGMMWAILALLGGAKGIKIIDPVKNKQALLSALPEDFRKIVKIYKTIDEACDNEADLVIVANSDPAGYEKLWPKIKDKATLMCFSGISRYPTVRNVDGSFGVNGFDPNASLTLTPALVAQSHHTERAFEVSMGSKTMILLGSSGYHSQDATAIINKLLADHELRDALSLLVTGPYTLRQIVHILTGYAGEGTVDLSNEGEFDRQTASKVQLELGGKTGGDDIRGVYRRNRRSE